MNTPLIKKPARLGFLDLKTGVLETCSTLSVFDDVSIDWRRYGLEFGGLPQSEVYR